MDTLQTIDEYEGRKHEVIIAVMGATGSGKSTFVRLVTGNEKIVIGETLNPGELNYEHLTCCVH